MSEMHKRRAEDRSCHTNLREVLLKSDATLAIVLLGFGLICWGSIGLVKFTDLEHFAADFGMAYVPVFWGLNSIGVGINCIAVACRGLPQMWSLILGTYMSCIYSIVAVARPASSVTSGVTLNFIVILVGMIIVQRSGKVR